jgi:hypothetical protein
MTDGGGADRMTGASSGWWRDMAPDGPQRWGKRQWLLLALALSPVPLMLLLLAIVAR